MKLRTRIALIAAAAVAAAVILVSSVAYIAAGRELRSAIDKSLVERAIVIQQLANDPKSIIGDDLAGRPAYGIFGGRGAAFDTVYYQMTLSNGEVLVPEGQALLPEPDVAKVQAHPVLSDERVDDVHLRMISFPSELLGVVQIARPLTEVDAALAGLAVTIFIFGAFGVLLAAGVGLLVAKGALKPIDDLAEAAERVAETQDFNERIDIYTDDEVGRLAARFNDMLAALEHSRDQQQRLVRDAGHELRTPLTALRTNIELLGKMNDLSQEQRSELITAADAEVKELSALVGEVVDLASDRYSEGPIEDLMLDDVVATSVERASRRTTIRFDVHSERSPVRGRPAALARAVDNLIENAVKWSPEDDDVAVVITVADGTVTVRDHGPGIDGEDLHRIFDRFYRSSSARSMQGSGLGLSIVKQVVEAHRGTVFASNAPDGGAIVGFELPEATGST